MPTYRSITISITSQFDICQLPEYAPPTSADDPFSTLPTLLNPELSLVTVYLPTYPSSQFWLRYSIAPPYPPKAIYYFKLFLNGKCVVSWGCGEEDGYRGRTVFGLFDSGSRWGTEVGIERRMMCFSGSEDPDDVMEVKVYRVRGRQRILPELQDYRDVMPNKEAEAPVSRFKGVNGISLAKAGILTQEHPKRFYNYALLDPLDKPFASFRYFPRTWDQLVALGVVSPTPSLQSSPQHARGRVPARNSSATTLASSQSNSSSSSSSANTHEETIISKAKAVALSPPSHALFRTRLPRPKSAQYSSSQKASESTMPASSGSSIHQAVTAPSLMSLSPPKTDAPTQPRFPSLVRRSRTPSPPKRDIRKRVPTPTPPSPTRDFSLHGPRPLPPLPTPDSTDGSSESPKPRSRAGSMGLLINAVNSAVSRKARAASESAREGHLNQNTIKAHQPENSDDAATADVESTISPAPSIATSKNKVEEEGHDGRKEEIDEVKDHAQGHTAVAENQSLSTQRSNSASESDTSSRKNQFLSIQRSTSASESDTSSKRAVKERKGFLKFNLLRKKVEAERSASSTPDSERHVQGTGESSPRKWRSWGRKDRSKDVDEMVKVEESEVSEEEHVDMIRERLRQTFRCASEIDGY